MPANLLLLLFPAAVQAAEEIPSGLSGGAFRLMAGLLLVLGLMLLLYALSKRGLRWLPKARPGIIQIREMRAIGAKKSLCLIRVGNKEMLLGVGPDTINLLCQLGEVPEEKTGENFDATLQQTLKDFLP